MPMSSVENGRSKLGGITSTADFVWGELFLRVLQLFFYRAHEIVDVPDGCINARRNAHAGVLGVRDYRCEDSVLGFQGTSQGRQVPIPKAEHPYAAGHLLSGVVQDPDLRVRAEGVCPAIPQIAQPGGLALDADILVEGNGFANGREVRRRVGADLLELADVVILPLAR